MYKIFAALIMPLLIIGCSTVYNYENARVYSRNSFYVLELKGKRRLMAHDLISAIKAETYEATLEIMLPRNSGRINGSDIVVKRGHYKYSGYVDIQAKTIVVDLKYINTDKNELQESGWSGSYKFTK